MQDKEFSNIVSERFDGFGDTPSDAVWENIASNLDGRKKRLAILWWTCSFAAALALSVLAVDSGSGYGNENIRPTASTSTSGKTQIEAQNKKQIDNQVNKQDNANSTSDDQLNSEQDSKLNRASNENPIQKTNLKKVTLDVSTADKLRLEFLPKVNFDILPEVGSRYLHLSPQEENNGTLVDAQKTNKEDSISYLNFAPLNRIPMETGENDIISLIQILPVPKWEFGVRVSGFINASRPTLGLQSDAALAWNNPGSFTPVELKSFSHIRYAEIEGYALYQTRSRFQFGGGISFSKGADTEESEYYRTTSNRTTVGVPLYGRFIVLKKGKFQISAEIALLNEYSNIRSTTDDLSLPSGTPLPADTSQSTAELSFSTTYTDHLGHGYSFGLQGGLETSYQLLPRMNLTMSFGYRNYLIERYSSVYNYVNNPGYVTGSLGVRWRLR